MLSGKNLAMTVFTNEGRGRQKLHLVPPFTGTATH